MNIKEEMLLKMLKQSTLTTGKYVPTLNIKCADHCAVLVDGKPVYLTGYADDYESISQAKQLSLSEVMAHALFESGIHGRITWGYVKGTDIDWNEEYECIVRSESSLEEKGGEIGELVGINLSNKVVLSLLLCVTNELTHILDGSSLKLNDHWLLSNALTPPSSLRIN